MKRWRTASTALLTVLGLIVYAALAATLGGLLPDHWAVQLAFYAVAGVIWVFPVIRLIAWANRDNVADGARR